VTTSPTLPTLPTTGSAAIERERRDRRECRERGEHPPMEALRVAKIAKMSFYSDDSVYPRSKSKLGLFFALFALPCYRPIKTNMLVEKRAASSGEF
jgi:hypothetical protein